jgi:putative addiction module killer protein
MYEIIKTEAYEDWLDGLRDRQAKVRIGDRLLRIETQGNFGVHKPVGDGVFELIFTFGPGYRVYYAVEGDTIVLLLGGGDKDTQVRDIANAKELYPDALEELRQSKEEPDGQESETK